MTLAASFETAADAPHGARQAALLLHTLDDADRQWLLSQLDPRARSEALTLLAELAALGVPADQSLREAVLAPAQAAIGAGAAEASPQLASAAPPNSASARLARTTVAEMSGLLQNEPDALIAALLREAQRAHADDWGWRSGVLDRLGPTRRRRVGELLADGVGTSSSGASALGAQVAELVAARLATPMAVAGTAPASGWLGRIAQRLSAWSPR